MRSLPTNYRLYISIMLRSKQQLPLSDFAIIIRDWWLRVGAKHCFARAGDKPAMDRRRSRRRNTDQIIQFHNAEVGLEPLRFYTGNCKLVFGGYGWTRTTDLSIMSAAL